MSIKDAGDAGNQKDKVYKLQVCPSLWSENSVCCQIPATIEVTAGDVIHQVAGRLNLDLSKRYVLAEVKEPGGEEWILDPNDSPVQRIKLWPRKAQEDHDQSEGYYFLLQERNTDGSIRYINLQLVAKEREQRRLVERGFLPPQQQLYDDLCNLPLLAEKTILENLKNRFLKQKIYTYAGSILIAINPFKFLPIYNPKYVKMYENHQLGKLEPHIFAIADVAYHTMLRKQINQCIVISGESGSGKTQSTNFLIHCLTALSQKGYASGVERTILGAGPVLEAFGNAKTAHNNNSSRFGKFIQVNYLESGIVRGAVVEKYLLEKSRLVSQENDERNYHVFYYLLMGATKEERREFHLQQPENYYYLNQKLNFCIDDGEDLKHDFERLKQAMEMVGFLHATKKQIFLVLSAILYLGNVTYKKKATGRDEGLEIGPPEVLETLSQLLKVKQEMLVEALTKRKTVTVGEKLILSYSLNEAITARDSMAKSLYSALFDWIVLRINHALLNKKDLEESVTCLSIGVLDIFGFEDFENNSFEQFCINYANEQLQYYFNQHIFKLEQEEYQSEGITWHNIDYTDNVGCIHLISRKPTGLFHLLDEESNFPHATNQTLLAKFKQQHEDNRYFVGTPVMEPAFVIQHFAGKVKYQIKDFREKNTDYMRPDIVALLRSSDSAFIRELIGMDPVSVFRWAILRATIRATAAFWDAGRREAQNHAGVMRRKPRVPLGELQRANTPAEKVYRELHAQVMRNIRGRAQYSEDPQSLLKPLQRLERPHSHLVKNKSFKPKQVIPKNLMDSSSLKHIVRMTLYDRTTKSLLHLHKKKKPPSISAQFQASLNKLMETLGKAEPFFIRCIRSNAKKSELCLDDELVLQQLKYTGMLETVRIRRSGYSAKYTFQEFVNQFQVLLPKNPKPAQEAISTLFHKMGLNRENCQIGKTKVFMKETERQKLQDTLHKEVMRKIILLQGWFRAVLEKRRFVKMRQAAITIQASWRSYQVRRFLQRNTAAAVIQVSWRRCCRRQKHRQQKRSIQLFQSASRGYLVRRSLRLKSEEEQRAREKARQEDEEREAQTRKTAAGSHKPERSTVEGESEAVFRSLAAESSEPEPPWLGSELTPGLMENGESQEQLSKSQENTSGAQGTERTSASREKRENRRIRGLEHEKFQRRLVSPNPEETTSHFPPPPLPSGTREQEVKTIDIVEKMAQNANKVGAVEPGKPEAGAGVVSTNEFLQEKEMASSRKIPKGFVNELRRMDEEVANQKRNHQPPSQSLRPTSLPLKTSPCPGQVTLTRSFSQSSDQEEVEQRPDSPGAHQGAIHRYNDKGELRNKAEKWKDRRQAETVTPTMPKKEAIVVRKESQVQMKDLKNKEISSPQDEGTKQNPGSPQREAPADGHQEADKTTTKHLVQKKSSQEHVDVGQVDPPKSTFRKPLMRFLGKRQAEKKSSKELPPTQDESESPTMPYVVQEVVKKIGERGEWGACSTLPRHTPPDHGGKEQSTKVKRSRSIKISNATTVSEQWDASVHQEITNSNELKHLDEFLMNKVNDLNSRSSHESRIETLFITTTDKFRMTLKSMYSVHNSQTHMGYKGLMQNYQLLLTSLAEERQKAEIQLVLNLFQSLLDEFARSYAKKEEAEALKTTKAQKKRRKRNQIKEEYYGHRFRSYQVNILQSCELCSSYIWTMERALLCCACNMTCHKKCLPKIQYPCSSTCTRKNNPNATSQHFGVSVCDLTNEQQLVPLLMEILLEYVEMHGLYTEGIYRKSGAANKMKELRQKLEADPTSVILENYHIHAITGLLKQWLRELPEPLMTYALYSDFLRAIEHPERQEQLVATYNMLEQLPPANHSTLERLIFHLVKVAVVEDTNRMSTNALAIVFAPCILLSPDTSDPLMSMRDVSKTTMCVELLISEQLRKYRMKMDEIAHLETAEHIAVRRLSLLRLWPHELRFSSTYDGLLNKVPRTPKVVEETIATTLESLTEESSDTDTEREQEILIERIQSIKEERDELTLRLPELEQRGSDEENMDSEASLSMESLIDERLAQAGSGGANAAVFRFTGKHRSQSIAGCQSTPTPDPVTAPAKAEGPRARTPALLRRPASLVSSLRLPRRNPVIPTRNIKLPHGILRMVDSYRWPPGRQEPAGVILRRREQPSRRSDNIRSMYIAAQEVNLTEAVGLVTEDVKPTPAKLQRRFSDPLSDMPYTDNS
ncbi:unconventional myosin-IXb isoform X2 [Callorhinchus milii]|uniref:unconventional myosin-IXb isoform X2 n=1 Tax=Callorhinchus milii TaxID=7868 RepID=UPI001C3FAABE|nr:unconventional myosin-IXb isoform X2 [Callorhinchus milii]